MANLLDAGACVPLSPLNVSVVIATLFSLFAPIVMVGVLVLFVIIFLEVRPRHLRMLIRDFPRLKMRRSRSGAA
jgi:hypothetical protein